MPFSEIYFISFHFREKSFIKDPKDLNGSPRTFVHYTYEEDVVPYPSLFVSGESKLRDSITMDIQ